MSEAETTQNNYLKTIQLEVRKEVEKSLLFLIPIEWTLAVVTACFFGASIIDFGSMFASPTFWLIGFSVLFYLYFFMARHSSSFSCVVSVVLAQLCAVEAVAYSPNLIFLAPFLDSLTLIIVFLFFDKLILIVSTLVLISVPIIFELIGYTAEVHSQSQGWRSGIFCFGTLAIAILLFSIAKRGKNFLETTSSNLENLEKLSQERNEFKNRIENLSESVANKLDLAGSTISQIVSVAGMSLTNDLATSAAQAATAVEETRTVVGQVKETVSLSHDRAQGAVQDSLSIQSTYHAGQKSTDAVIKGMQRIQDCMNSIAESMVQLSNQTLQIGEIIMTVDSIAQQSNLLSVNAAVEAASAGEHGKGFVVVAREVKNLAMQSKKATAKVRVVLNEISAAATKATMDTEQGTKAVVDGQILAGESSKSIRVLNDNVMKTKIALDQIEQFAGDQLLGIEQIANAMNGLKEASDKNLVCSRDFSEALTRLVSLNSSLTESAAEIRAISKI